MKRKFRRDLFPSLVRSVCAFEHEEARRNLGFCYRLYMSSNMCVYLDSLTHVTCKAEPLYQPVMIIG